MLDLFDQPRQIEVLILRPRALEDGRDQDMLAALEWVRIDSEEAEKTGRRRVDALTQELHVLDDGRARRGKRLQDGDRKAGAADRGENSKVGGLPKSRDPLAVLSPC